MWSGQADTNKLHKEVAQMPTVHTPVTQPSLSTLWGHRKKTSICKPGKEPSPEPDLISDLQDAELWENTFPFFKWPSLVFCYGSPKRLTRHPNLRILHNKLVHSFSKSLLLNVDLKIFGRSSGFIFWGHNRNRRKIVTEVALCLRII